MKKQTRIISDTDRQRLAALIQSSRLGSQTREEYLAVLEAELGRARAVPPGKVPPDVVTMNSVVRVQDLVADVAVEYELVYPADADIDRGRISVLSPVGTALIGHRAGDVIAWRVPAGERRLRVDSILYQPERSGALHR